MSKLNSVSLIALSGLVAASFSALPASAQEVLRGRVVDGAGSPLPGARITAPDAGVETATNRQGEFSFPSVPAGDLRIEVDYLGFPSATRTVSVTAGASNAIIVTLGEDDQALERVVVRGAILDGTARALNQQRTNDATTNIVSSDAIGRFPDSNIAEALQRVPGFAVQRDQGEGRTIQLRGAPSEFTSVSVNGISIAAPDESTRAIDLDTIPSDVVAAIEVSKTLLPYQQADSIAGAVNLVTRSPFDRRGLQVNLTGGLSHNEIGDTNDYRYSGVVSNTFGAAEQFGALFSASYSQTNRQIDNIENGWGFINVGGQDIAFSDDFTLKDYDTERTRTAFTGAFEFRPDDATRFVLNGAWSRFEDKEFRNRLTYDLGTPQPGFTDTTATFTGARLVRQLRNREVENTIWTVSGTGEHDFGAYQVDYTVGFTRTEGIRPQGNELVLRTGANRTVSYDFANPDEPFFSPFANEEQLNFTGLGYRQVVDRTNENIQEEWSAQANFTMEDLFFSQPAQYRFGASARFRDTNHDEERWRDRTGAGIFNPGPISGLLSNNRSQNFSYLLGTKFDEGLIRNYFDTVQPTLRSAASRLDDASTESDYTVEENIIGVYGMTRVSLANTDIIAGLRIETTNFSSGAFEFDADTEIVTPTSNSRSYTNYFPNLTIRQDFSDNLVGRLALTRAISRPNFPDVVARVFVDDGEVERGNPELRPTLSNNFDIGLEYYFEPLGLVAVNLFYKDLENYEFTGVSSGIFRDEPVTFIEAQNASSGFLRGVELTWQQTFTFLPGQLGNTGIFANATFTEGEMDIGNAIPGRGGKLPLAGQSDRVYNVAVFYETERFNARLSYVDRSDYLDGVESDPRLDVYWEGRSQLDLTASLNLTQQLEFFLEAKNLTDTEGVRYDGVRNRVQERERFGRIAFLGARYRY